MRILGGIRKVLVKLAKICRFVLICLSVVLTATMKRSDTGNFFFALYLILLSFFACYVQKKREDTLGTYEYVCALRTKEVIVKENKGKLGLDVL